MLLKRLFSVLNIAATTTLLFGLVSPTVRALTYDEVVRYGAQVRGVTVKPVSWVNLTNTTASGGAIIAAAGSTQGVWDKGGKSSEQITAGDGYFEFTKPDTQRDMLVGLGAASTAVPSVSLNYGLQFYQTYVEVRENGTYKKDVTYLPGDVFRISVTSGVVTYLKNGTVFYTSAATISYPLVAFATFSVIGQQVVSGAISYVNATAATTPTTTPSVQTTPPPTVAAPDTAPSPLPALQAEPATTPVPATATTTVVTTLQLTNIQVANLQPTSATVSWDTTVAADSYVRFGTTTRMTRIALDANVVTSHSFALSGLVANKTYYYQIRSRAGGKSVYSTRGTFKTPVAAPAPPPITSPTPTPTPVPIPTPVPTPSPIVDGYGDTLSASAFTGWFYSEKNDTSATVTYLDVNTLQTHTQVVTRTQTRTDAVTWLTTTYGTPLQIMQPLGFSVNPSAVVTTPGTYKIRSVVLNTSGTLIQLSSAAQGAFVVGQVVTATPTPTPTPPPPTTTPTPGATSLLGLSDKLVYAPPTSGVYAYNSFKPALGQSYIDPIFGTKVTRMSDNGGTQGDGTLYVANGLWNADGTYHIYDDSKLGTKSIVNTTTGATVRTNIGYDTNSQFDPLNPDVLYKWTGANLVRYNVSTGVDTVVKTFPGTLQSLGGSLDWISADGQYFLLAWNGQLHIWNKALDVIYSGAITKTIGSGWAAITPDGKYVVIVDDPADNRYSYAIDHAARTLSSTGVMFWNESSDDHSDLVSASDGKNYLILFENNYVAGVYAVDISQNMAGKTPDQQRASNRKLVDLDWSVQADGHFSCVGRGALRDWCVVSTVSTGDTYNSNPSPWYAFKQEIFAVNVLTGEVRRFAHHRSRSVGMANYYAFPRANVTWDGNKIWFASNFDTTASYYSDVYKIDIAQ